MEGIDQWGGGMTQYSATYRGKPLDDMTKEELIDVIKEMAEWAEGIRKQAQHEIDVLSAKGPYSYTTLRTR